MSHGAVDLVLHFTLENTIHCLIPAFLRGKWSKEPILSLNYVFFELVN